MKTWIVDIGFKLKIGGPEREPDMSLVRGFVLEMLQRHELGVANFRVNEADEEAAYIKDLSNIAE